MHSQQKVFFLRKDLDNRKQSVYNICVHRLLTQGGQTNGTEQENKALDEEIETAYLEKEIERMYERLAKSGRDTATVSYKLASLKRRSHKREDGS